MDWLKVHFILVLFFMGSLSTTVLAAHTLGSGYSGRIETDGFDDGYYLAVWGTSSGFNGILYWIKNNTVAKNLSPIVTSGRAVNKISLASRRGFITQKEENKYFIAWRTGEGLYGTILYYDGSVQNESIPIYTSSTVSRNMLAAGYGEVIENGNSYGYFVVVYALGTNKELRYAVLDENGNIKSDGVLWEPDDPNYLTTLSRRVAFDGKYFGVAFRVSEESGDYVYVYVFSLTSSGGIDKNYVARLENPANTTGRIPIVGRGNGFVMAYYKDYKWYTVAINIDNGVTFSSSEDVTPPEMGNPGSGGSLDLVWNTTAGAIQYIAMTYPNGNNQLVVEKLNRDGTYSGNYWTISGSGPYNYPFVAVKPMRSPEAFTLLWKTGASGYWTASEYMPRDGSLVEVSTENQVPFFGGSIAVFLAVLGGLILFRRR